MTLVAKIDGVTLPDGALLIGGAPNSEVPGGIGGLMTSAWYGEAPSVGIVLDDPDGDLDSVLSLGSLHTFTVDETACTGKERIWSGWLTASRISRGPYESGASRIWDIDIIDVNWAFNLMVFRASSAKRPAETDIVRVAFGRASAPMAYTPLADNGRFNVTDNPVAFDEADYVGKFPIELFASVAGTAGKNFYAYWDHDEEELSMHYDLVGVGPTSTLAISNVIADSDSTTFYPFIDAELRRDGAWKVTGMLFNYKGAYAYGVRTETIDELSPTEFSPDQFQRDEVYSSDRVGQLATAQALIARMLEERAQDQETISCSIRVPASQVNLIEAGDVINAKFTHLPGYEAGVDIPVIRRNVVPTPGRTDSYDIHLELSGAAKPIGPAGGPPGVFVPPRVTCDPDNITIVQTTHASVSSPSAGSFHHASWASPPTEGNLLLCAYMVKSNSGNDPGTMTGWTRIDGEQFIGIGGAGGNIFVFWKIATSSEDTRPATSGGSLAAGALDDNNGYLIEVAGVNTFDTSAKGHSETASFSPGVPITPTAGKVGFIVTFMEMHQVLVGGPPAGGVRLWREGDISDGGNPARWIGYLIVADTSGAYDVNPEPPMSDDKKWTSLTIAFYCDPTGDVDLTCPDSGQWTDWLFLADGDGTTTTFTIDCPYADGGLLVQVDGQPVIVGLTESDPAAGEFTLDFAPLGAQGDAPAEQVWVKYQGR